MAIIETSTFRLADGVDDVRFRRADHDVQTEFFSPRAGFIRRTTSWAPDGEWLVITLWSSDAAAQAAAAEEDDAVSAFERCIDPSSVVVRRYETLD